MRTRNLRGRKDPSQRRKARDATQKAWFAGAFCYPCCYYRTDGRSRSSSRPTRSQAIRSDSIEQAHFLKPVVVLDTNPWVSACLRPTGNPARIVQFATQGAITLRISPDIRQEVTDLLQRPRILKSITRYGMAVSEWLEAVQDLVSWTSGSVRVDAVPSDPDDNIVVACALESGADYIVSGDHNLLNLKS